MIRGALPLFVPMLAGLDFAGHAGEGAVLPGVALVEICRGIVPIVIALLIAVALIFAVPKIAT